MEVTVNYSGQQHLITHTTTSNPPNPSRTAYMGYNYRYSSLDQYEANTDLLFHRLLFDEDTNLDTGQRHVDSTWNVSRSANVLGAGLTWIQYTFTDVPGGYPTSTNDGTFVRYGALKLMWADFVKPSQVPHKAQENGQPWALPLSCTMVPMLSSSEYTDFTLTIFDPCRPDYKRVWTDAGSDGLKNGVVSVVWDGLLHLNGNPAAADYTHSSDIFMTARLSFPSSTIAPANPIIMENPDIALGVRRGPSGAYAEEATVEPGTDIHYRAVPQWHNFQMHTPVDDIMLGFHGKAFKHYENPVVYDEEHLLQQSEEEPINPLAADFKYITGSKSQVSDTDLGERRISMMALCRDAYHVFFMRIIHFDLDLLIRRENDQKARITFYYIPYENNPEFGSIRDGSITIGGTEYYFNSTFTGRIRTQGTGKVYRLSQIENSSVQDGAIPMASQQYIEYNPDPYPGVYAFVSTPKVHSQDGARCNVGPASAPVHRSYYNLQGAPEYRVIDIYSGNYYSTYDGISDFANYARTHFASSPPLSFVSDIITIRDQGEFDGDTERRARQIDVFLEASDDIGLNRFLIGQHFGECWARVERN